MKTQNSPKVRSKAAAVKKSPFPGRNKTKSGKAENAAAQTGSHRPKYNMWQNSAYMIALAWKRQKTVLLFCLIIAGAGITSSTAELLVVPAILNRVETAAPLNQLLGTILGFTAVLMLSAAIGSYINTNAIFGRIDLRAHLADLVQYKFCVTSYPNTEDASALRKLEKAEECFGGNDSAAEAVWDTFTGLLKNLVCFLIYLLFLFSLPPLLWVTVLVTSVTGYLAGKRIQEWEYRHSDEKAGYLQKIRYLIGTSQERRLAKDIRIFNLRPWLDDLYDSTLRLLRAFAARRERIYLWQNILDIVLSFARNGIAYAFLIGMALEGELSASEFLLYFTVTGSFTQWIGGILGGLSTLHAQSLNLSMIREFLELPEPFLFQDGKSLDISEARCPEICLDHVSFRYPGAEKDTLQDLNLNIHPGEKLAVVGLNGAGKTTLIKLLCGFYDPTKGRVLLNGQDIRQYNRQDYYHLFSAVFQQFSLLEATIYENITQAIDNGSTTADPAKARDCIEKAGLTKKLESLPDHMNTRLGRQVYENGVELSGGELQRLMLARALYKEGSILVLDEPTAALDPIAENDIYLKYNEMTAEHTSVYISHRLASTRFCDRIIFLSDGKITEEGTHNSLMARNGKYADLFRIQSKYYQEGESSHEA